LDCNYNEEVKKFSNRGVDSLLKATGLKAFISFALIACSLTSFANAGHAKEVAVEAAVIDGEVYIKASSLAKTLGLESGTYDPVSGTYLFESANSVTEVVLATSPSVVAIIGKPQDNRGGSNAKNDRFRLSHGTGVIYKSDGWIVTNAHVVKDMKQIVVITADGKQYSGTKMNIDEESDIALVKIDATGLTVAKFPETMDMQVGETVVAIGTPISFSLRNTVTVGVVSGTDRSVNSTYRLIQTDAAINPGNSGGALVNLRGEVIGINSMKFAAVGVDNIGFAIPSDTVLYVLKQFQENGKVKRPSLGFTVEESWLAVVGLPTDEPLKVTLVHKNSTAEQAGVKEGDLLYSVDDVGIRTIVDLNEFLKKYEPGQTAAFIMQSDGDLVKREFKLGEDKNNLK
jgi:serine protease Do